MTIVIFDILGALDRARSRKPTRSSFTQICCTKCLYTFMAKVPPSLCPSHLVTVGMSTPDSMHRVAKKVTKIVVRNPVHADYPCRPVHGLLAFMDSHHGSFSSFVRSLSPQLFEQLSHIWNHGHFSDLAVLCSSYRITPHNDFASGEITICPSDVRRFSFSKATKGQEPNEGSAVS